MSEVITNHVRKAVVPGTPKQPGTDTKVRFAGERHFGGNGIFKFREIPHSPSSTKTAVASRLFIPPSYALLFTMPSGSLGNHTVQCVPDSGSRMISLAKADCSRVKKPFPPEWIIAHLNTHTHTRKTAQIRSKNWQRWEPVMSPLDPFGHSVDVQ